MGLTPDIYIKTIISCGLLGAALLHSPDSGAHQRDSRFRAIGTVAASGDTGLSVDVLLLQEIPQGERATRLILRYDLDRSGDLGPLEAQALSAALGPETVGGYVLRIGGAASRPTGLKTTAALTEAGGVAVAVMLNYKVPGCEAADPCRVQIDVLDKPGGATPVLARPLVTELQVLSSLVLVKTSHRAASDAPVIGPAELLPGAPGMWVDVTRPAPLVRP